MRWVLLLAVLAVGVGLVLLWVAGPRERRGSAERGPADPGAQGQRGARAGASGAGPRSGAGRGSRDPHRARGRVDRQRLARLLGPGMGGATDPGRGAPGGGSPRGGATGAPGDWAAEQDPVWPLSAKGIRGAIQARIEEIKACYRGWLATDDELGGKLVLAFRIERDPEGEHARIASAEIQGSTLEHPGLERCVLVMAESLSFEVPPEEGITVRYPFRFKPSAD